MSIPRLVLTRQHKFVNTKGVYSDKVKGVYGVLRLHFDDGSIRRVCETIERPWQNNRRSVSCIPTGIYPLIKRVNGRYATAYKKRWNHDHAYEIGDVKNRSAIMIHTGRNLADSRGCVLVAKRVVVKNGKLSSNGTSRDAYRDMWAILECLDITEITVE